ncbi:MAG: hypothetical protein WCJ30_19780, partial [Deltaproteobacteria bacterium]
MRSTSKNRRGRGRMSCYVEPGGALVTDDACSRAVIEVAARAQAAFVALTEATNAQGHVMQSESEAGIPLLSGPDDVPGAHCRRVSAAARRAIMPRILSAAVNGAGSDEEEGGVRTDFGCIDAGGHYLVRVSDQDLAGHSLIRAGRGGVRSVFEGSLGHPMVADLTGDGIMEFVWHESSSWYVMSSSWAAAIERRSGDSTARSGRRLAIVLDGERAGLILDGHVTTWDGRAFSPVAQGFEALRHALDREDAACPHLQQLGTVLHVSTPAWAIATSAPCDDATRVAWAISVVEQLTAFDVARTDSLRLATAPVGLANCPAGSAWRQAAGLVGSPAEPR